MNQHSFHTSVATTLATVNHCIYVFITTHSFTFSTRATCIHLLYSYVLKLLRLQHATASALFPCLPPVNYPTFLCFMTHTKVTIDYKVLLENTEVILPCLLNRMPRLLFISSCNFVRLLFESGYYSRAVFIKLSGICKISWKSKGFEKIQFYKN